MVSLLGSMSGLATHESLAAMGDLVSKLVAKHGTKNKQILDGDITIRKRKKVEQRSKKEISEKRKAKKEILEKGRSVDNTADILNERILNKVATKGIIQLFNAVKTHQSDITTKLKKTKTEAQKDKVHKTVSTGSFLDLIRPKDQPLEKTTEDKKWDVLKDDFMLNSKLKDWKKKEEEDEEESDGSIDKNEDPESDMSEDEENECSSD